MAKIGKQEPDFDPFSAGKKAFEDLDAVLVGLDQSAPAEERATTTAPPKRAKSSTKTKRISNTATEGNSVLKRVPSGKIERENGGQAPAPAKKPKTPVETASEPKKPKKFLTTDDEAKKFDKAAMRLGAELGISLDFSKLTRALWEVYLRHEPDIVRNAPTDVEWKRPQNSDTVGLAELDERLANLLNDGLMIASRRPKNARQSEPRGE